MERLKFNPDQIRKEEEYQDMISKGEDQEQEDEQTENRA